MTKGPKRIVKTPKGDVEVSSSTSKTLPEGTRIERRQPVGTKNVTWTVFQQGQILVGDDVQEVDCFVAHGTNKTSTIERARRRLAKEVA